MANRYQEDLKRIVGITDAKGGIAPQGIKKSISGGRGIVYFNSNGETETVSGTPAETLQPGGYKVTDENGNGGSNSGNTGIVEPALEMPYPVEDATQADSGMFSVDGLGLGDIVKGVFDLKDCATGKPVEVRFDGEFTAPEGWGDADTPGAIDPNDALAMCEVIWGAEIGGFALNPGSTTVGDTSGDPVLYKCNYGTGEGNWPYGYNYYRPSFINQNDLPFYPAGWPSSKPMQLSYDAAAGLYKTHPMDGNVTTEYTTPVSSFSLCNQAGDPIKSYPTADGGQAIYNSTSGISTFINKSGKVTGFGDSQAITNSLPK